MAAHCSRATATASRSRAFGLQKQKEYYIFSAFSLIGLRAFSVDMITRFINKQLDSLKSARSKSSHIVIFVIRLRPLGFPHVPCPKIATVSSGRESEKPRKNKKNPHVNSSSEHDMPERTTFILSSQSVCRLASNRYCDEVVQGCGDTFSGRQRNHSKLSLHPSVHLGNIATTSLTQNAYASKSHIWFVIADILTRCRLPMACTAALGQDTRPLKLVLSRENKLILEREGFDE